MAAPEFRASTGDPFLDAARGELIYAALLLRRMLDVADSVFSGPDDDELLAEATTRFCEAADDYEAQADRLTRKVLGPNGVAAKRWDGSPPAA
jgi:hypothetical protein